MNNSQLIEQDKFSYYFAKGGGKFLSLTLVTQNGVCINSWLMLQMETRTQIHIKLRITSSICWMWANISSKSHCTFTLLLKSLLGKTLKLWAHGQQPTSQRRSELLMDVTLQSSIFCPEVVIQKINTKCANCGEMQPPAEEICLILQVLQSQEVPVRHLL